MSELLAKIYIGLLIGSGLLGLLPHIFRLFKPSPESNYSRKQMLRRRSLCRECLHLVVGVTILVLFCLSILSGWGVLVVGGIILILIEYALVFLFKPQDVRSE